MINPLLRPSFFEFLKICDRYKNNVECELDIELLEKEYAKIMNTLFFLTSKYGYLFPVSKFKKSEETSVLLHPFDIEDTCYTLFFIILFNANISSEEIKFLEDFIFTKLKKYPILVPIPRVRTKYYKQQAQLGRRFK